MKRKMLVLILFWMIGVPNMVYADQKIPILIYHSIDEFKGTGSKELYVTPQNFKKQMMYLKEHGYTLLTFEQWSHLKDVKNPIFITVDDGYKNNLNMVPIFQDLKTEKFSPRATLFVISDFIGRPNRLSENQLKQMTDSGFFSIQSHTSTHPDLTKIDHLGYELRNSKQKIEKITGKPVLALSYPYGNTDNRVIEETKKYYSFGLTTTPSLYMKTGMSNELFLLPRIYVKYSTSLADFAKLLRGQ